MRLHGRLLRLERRLGAGDGGCAACRDRRGRVVLVAGRMAGRRDGGARGGAAGRVRALRRRAGAGRGDRRGGGGDA